MHSIYVPMASGNGITGLEGCHARWRQHLDGYLVDLDTLFWVVLVSISVVDGLDLCCW